MENTGCDSTSISNTVLNPNAKARNNDNNNKDNSGKLKNRSKLDIIYDILVSAVGGVKKTHIMSRANLSSEQMNFYFNTLLSNRLLDMDKDGESNMIYRTTNKGVKFLQCCGQIKLLVSPMIKGKTHNDMTSFLYL